MSETNYAPEPIKCRECGETLKTIEKGHLQSENCTEEIEDVDHDRQVYPDAPTRTEEMRDDIVDGLNSTGQ